MRTLAILLLSTALAHAYTEFRADGYAVDNYNCRIVSETPVPKASEVRTTRVEVSIVWRPAAWRPDPGRGAHGLDAVIARHMLQDGRVIERVRQYNSRPFVDAQGHGEFRGGWHGKLVRDSSFRMTGTFEDYQLDHTYYTEALYKHDRLQSVTVMACDEIKPSR
jgi:hypothetical protein